MGTRTLVFVRHGQYSSQGVGSLTDLGREQARRTGVWLADQLADTRVDVLWSSTLVRARETAALIADSFGRMNLRSAEGGRHPEGALKIRPTGVLREGMYSKLKDYPVPADERAEDRTRADQAWVRLSKKSRTDRLELVVCHGNLIRYLVCRAMRVPVGRWTRLNSHHCGVTRILIRDTGAIRVVAYNETAHLPRELVT
jgi:serine/threonine-protein phosphatase PGAM5